MSARRDQFDSTSGAQSLRLTRRGLLARAVGIGAGAAATAFLAACGGTAATATTAKPSAAASTAPSAAASTGGAASAAPAASAAAASTAPGSAAASARPSAAASSAATSAAPSAAASAAGSAAPSGNPFGNPTKRGGTYIFGTSGESVPRNFIGTSYYGTTAFLISKMLYMPLVILDKDWVKINPAIATKWQWSTDNKQLTMTIRKDIKFHDGSPVTVQDIEFTYKLMVRNDTNPAVQDITIFEGGDEYKKGTTDTFKGVTVVDDSTIRFNLTSPSSVFLLNVSNCGILPAKAFPADALNAGGDMAKLDFFNGKAIGSGPFKIKSYDSKTALTLEAHKDYYKGAPVLDGIVFRFGLLAPAQVAALQSGEIDAALLTPKDAASLANVPSIGLNTSYALANETVLINATDKDYLNVKVRQGLLTAIDVPTLIKTVGYNFPKPAPSVMMHASLFPNPTLPTYTYSVDKAKALLAEGKWDASRKLKFGRWTAQGTPDDIDSAIMTMWKAVGVEAEYLPMDSANQVKISKEIPHVYDVAITSFAWLAYDPSSSYSSFATERRPNYSNYSNPDFDSAMKEAIRTVDEKSSVAAYQKAQTILQTDLPYAPVWMDPEIFAINKKVHGGVFGRGPLNDVSAELWWKE